MRTRKFLSKLIPALPALLAAFLVIPVVVIFLTAMRSKAHAQFGGAEQPFFQSSSATQWTPALLTNKAHWWVASDLPVGSVSTGWVDRVQGVRLTNDITANVPTVVSNYVDFSNDFLSNALPTILSQPWAFYWIAKSPPGPWATTQLFISGGGGTPTVGTGFNYRNPSTFRYNVTAFTWNVLTLTNGNIFDQGLNKYNNNTAEVFTNGVSNAVVDGGGSITWNAYLGFGNSPDQSTANWTGRLYEFMIFTNVFLDSTTISNLHHYATNTYGFGP